jgi:CRISPR-associated protein Cas1
MAWKGVHITQPGRLSLADGQLVVAQGDGNVRLPLEDIGWVIIDDPGVTLTTSLLAGLATHGIALATSDARHMPSMLALPFHGHHRQAGVARDQLAWTLPFRKRCWQAIVQAKIINQAAVLDGAEKPHADTLLAMARQVGSGDPDNVEARAARQYWQALFPGFTRGNEADLRNKALNYGYAVLRAVISRALVGAGFLPCLGLWHDSATNAFNLADDLIEPFRPVCDQMVETLCRDRDPASDLVLQDRRRLAGLPGSPVLIAGEGMTVLHACERMVASLGVATAFNEPARLTLPQRAPEKLP